MPRNKFINLTGTSVVSAGEAWLEGMYVNSTTSATIQFYDNASGVGIPIGGVITPAIGYHYLGSLHCTLGVFANIAGTMDVTVHLRETD